MARKRNSADRSSVRSDVLSDPVRRRAAGSVFTAARARAQLINDLGPVVLAKPERSRIYRDTVRSSDAAPLSRSSPDRKPVETLKKADQLDLRRPEPDACKARPARSKGSGGSRPYVPWCSKRR